MFKVAVCDDVPQIANRIGQLLEEYDRRFDVSVYYDSEKLLQHMNHHSFDFYLLDIEMPKNSGIVLSERIRKNDLHVPIIFLTSFREYMEEVFRLQVFDYLLKPVNETQIYSLLNRVTQYIYSSNQRFVFSYNKKTYCLLEKEILFFEKNKRQVIIHIRSEKYVSNMNTREINAQLGKEFVQIHASYIVNSRAVKEIGKNYVLLHQSQTSPIELPISRKYKEAAHEQILFRKRGFFK